MEVASPAGPFPGRLPTDNLADSGGSRGGVSRHMQHLLLSPWPLHSMTHTVKYGPATGPFVPSVHSGSGSGRIPGGWLAGNSEWMDCVWQVTQLPRAGRWPWESGPCRQLEMTAGGGATS